MTDALLDALIETLELIPFLFLTYLVMEWLEHAAGERTERWIRRSGRLGPLLGAAVGLFPQCGFSAAASNLYAARLISRGTLLAVFLATSDEMLPILITQAPGFRVVFSLLAIKFLVGLIAGFAVDLLGRHFARQDASPEPRIHELCEQEHCNCEQGVLRSALRHTVNIGFFLLLAAVILNLAIYFLGEDSLGAFLQRAPVLSVLLTALAGLIPNCAPSVIMTQLNLQGAISLGAAMAGHLVGAGLGFLVLFRMNRNRRDNIQIVLTLYVIGAAVGLLLAFLAA